MRVLADDERLRRVAALALRRELAAMDVPVAAGAGGLEAGQMPGGTATARELPRLHPVAAVAGDALVRAGQREACPLVRKADDGEAGRRDGVAGLTRRAQLAEMHIVMA